MEQYNASGKKQCMGCMEFYGAAYDICPHCGYEEGEMARELLHIDPGTLLMGRYIVGRALGYGGFGVTYIGWDKQLNRKLAIKEYLPSEFATRMIHQQDLIVANNEKKHKQYTDGMKKFLQEGQKLARVSNVDGIVHMYDCFEANNTAYITMEYLDGETLASYLEREGTLSEQQALDLIMPVLQALEIVHEKGIIHRDIAPDNIFLARDRQGDLQVKLIDFGAAKFATTSHSKSLTVIIKPGYSPEEQYRSNGDQGTYTDVYALAAVIYRMVTGIQPPDAFERRTMIETRKKDPLEYPTKYNKNLSANFETALLNAMNVRVEDRTASIGDFEAELISFEPVKRRGSSIRRIDFMRWPLWAKIGVPLGSIAASILLVWGLVAAFSNPETTYKLPEGMTRVPDFVTADFAQAQEWADEAVLLFGSAGTEYVPNAEENIVLSQDVYSGAVVLENTMVSVVVSTGEAVYTLPDVTGMSLENATKVLECMGVEILVSPSEHVNGLAMDCVAVQSVAPYTELRNGDPITLTVTEAESCTAEVAPGLVGLSYTEALQIAADAGVVLRVTERVFTDEYADQQILTQSVEEGKKLKDADAIEVTIAASKKQFKMPNLLYKSLDTAEQLLKNIGVETTIEQISSEIIAKDLVAEQSVEKDQAVMSGDVVTLTVSSGSKPFAMPNVIGQSEEDARRVLTDSALTVSVEYDYDKKVPEGNVISQSVNPDKEVTRGTSITIVVCSTKDLISVADVTGMTAEKAKKTLEADGLSAMIEEVYSSDDDEGRVLSQLPKAGSYQKAGTKIVLTVSKGAKRVEVPDVIGMSKSAATAALKKAGFAVNSVDVFDSDSTMGEVISQNPGSGSKQIDGTTITIKVSKGAKPSEAPETLPEPVWSDWMTSLPSGVSEATNEVKTKTQYRSRTRETTTSNNDALEGWTAYDVETTWSEYGPWSEWSTTEVKQSETTNVMSKKQYRHRSKVPTTVTTYGEWSEWQDTPITGNDNLDVETQQVQVAGESISYTYGAYFPSGASVSSKWTHFCDKCGKSAYGGTWTYKTYTQSSRASVSGLGQSCGHHGTFAEQYRAADGYLYYYETVNTVPAQYKTQYRSREIIYTTEYEWGEFSDWIDANPGSSYIQEVGAIEFRMVYRCRTREPSHTYYYERFGEWSSWTDSKITATDILDVETRKLYRYRMDDPLGW